MRNVLMTEAACQYIEGLQAGEDYELTKEMIADSFTSLIELIEHGRDNEDISGHTDNILKVMYALGRFNNVINALHGTSDREFGRFELKTNVNEEVQDENQE